MGQEGKIERDVELQTPADSFYKRLKEELHHLTRASPDNIQGVEVREGDFRTPGSVREWSYTIDGKKELYKERLEIDETDKSVKLVAVDGHILQQYKTYKIILQVVPKGDGAAIVKAIIVYEKLNETDGDPYNYLLFLTGLMKDLDKHSSKKA